MNAIDVRCPYFEGAGAVRQLSRKASQMTSHKSKIPTKIVDYFGSDDVGFYESFKPGRGWRREAPRISLTRIRQLRAAGVTVIAVRNGTRIADFNIAELKEGN
jgi:hypothetical protein